MTALATTGSTSRVAGRNEGARPGAHRSNGFDLIRLAAAVMVLWGHSAALAGSEPGGMLGNSVSTIGVKIFFVISGFLITKSWVSDPSPVRFVWRRTLRIMPGLVCICVLTVAVLGPAFTSLGPAAYAANAHTWLYLWNIALYPVYGLPGVFAHNTYPGAVNGSLWSLPAEVSMYVLVPFVMGRARGRVAVVLCGAATTLAALFVVRVMPAGAPPVVYGTSLVSLLDAAPYFQAGALWAAFGLERHARPLLSLAMLAGAGWLVRSLGAPAAVLAEMLLLLLLPYATISVGILYLPAVARLLALGDFSYGLYLYGFPVQQAAMALSGNRLSSLGEFALALPVTVALAVASWFLVERPALSWKPRRAAA